MEKKCPHCRETKPLGEFYFTPQSKRPSSWCKVCRRVQTAEYKRKHPEEKRVADAKRRTENRELIRQQMHEYHLRTYETRREKIIQYGLEYRRRIRQEVLNAYGARCACCGESVPEFLGIDHIEGGGVQHRKSLKAKGFTFYVWLKKQNYPLGYQCLCHNCNQAKGLYGVCPHQR